MKILFLFKYHQRQIEHIESRAQKLQLTTYQERLDFVASTNVHFFLTLIAYFKRLGHSAEIYSPNFKFLQSKWAEENNIVLDNNWQYSLPKEQIKKFGPDILFISSNFDYFGDFVKDVRPYVKKVCAWISCPFEKDLYLGNIDHVFTLFQPHYDYFKSKNISATLTRAGFDPLELKELSFEKKYEVTFIGGIGKFHKIREKYLRAIARKTPLKIWGYGFVNDNPVKNAIKKFLVGSAILKAYQGESWGKEMLQIHAGSKICFNIHGDIAAGHFVNMRMFEVTGVGSLLLTEYNPEITDIFIPDKEIVCYNCIEEAIEKINYYLSHDDERQKIAMAGQEKCLKNYSYEPLALEYIKEFQKLLNI